jgi:hypothetical protein
MYVVIEQMGIHGAIVQRNCAIGHHMINVKSRQEWLAGVFGAFC